MISQAVSFAGAHLLQGILIGAALILALFALGGALALVGDPGSCGPERGGNGYDAELARAVDDRWHDFDDSARGPDYVRFSDEELTARAREYAKSSRAPVSDVVICLGDGYADGYMAIELPLGITVRLRAEVAHVDLNLPHPEPQIRNIRVGGVPAVFTSPLEGAALSLINRALGEVDLERDYQPAIFEEGWLEIRKQD